MNIAISGSMCFAKEMLGAKQELEASGHIVATPEFLSENRKTGSADVAEKKELDIFNAYFTLLQQSDALVVINEQKKGITGYIGANTLIEMAFAHVLHKKIYLLNPIPTMDYTTEILAMNVNVLHGDFTKVI